MNVSTSSVATTTVGDTLAGMPTSPMTSTTPAPSKFAAKIAVNFINTSNDANLIVACSRILNAMSGNPHYPLPVPTLAAVTAARDGLLAAVNVPDGNKSKLTFAARRQLRPELVALLRQLAQYVQTASKGDPVVLTGSGFPLQRRGQPVGVLPAPAHLRLARGLVSGQLRARCNVVTQASAYQWRIASVETPTVWLHADPTVAAKATLRGLVPGTQYVVQVRAIGTKGPGDWSNAATQIAM